MSRYLFLLNIVLIAGALGVTYYFGSQKKVEVTTDYGSWQANDEMPMKTRVRITTHESESISYVDRKTLWTENLFHPERSYSDEPEVVEEDAVEDDEKPVPVTTKEVFDLVAVAMIGEEA